MGPDIIAAIVSYLQGTIGSSLVSATGAVQVYADYAPEVNPDGSEVITPYAIVDDGPEVYTFQSNDPASGHWMHRFADGTAQLGIYATSKAQARALARQAAAVLSDTELTLTPGDAPVLAIFGSRSDPMRLPISGIGQPTIYGRVVTFQYKQEMGV